MDFFDKLFPLILLFIFWTLSNRSSKKRKEGPPVPVKEKPVKRTRPERLLPLAEKHKDLLFKVGEESTVPTLKTAAAEPPKQKNVPPVVEKIPEPVRRRQCRGDVPFRPGRRRLRRAIIWSEILAPPLALRDE